MTIDSLEPRTLLAIAVPTITSRGTLVVSGSSQDERIVVTIKNDKTRVIVRDTLGTVLLDRRYHKHDFKRVAVNAGEGNDLVLAHPRYAKSLSVNGGAGNDVILEGSGAAVLDGGAGNDIVGRPGDDAFENPVTLFGGDGNDLLQPDLTDFADGGAGIDAIGRDTSARTIQTNGIESSSRFVAGVDAFGALRVTGTDNGEEISIFAKGPLDTAAGHTIPVYADVTAFSPELLYRPLINVDLTDFTSVILDGIGGNDDLVVAWEIDKPITLNGGQGNDLLRAFRNAVLNGGEGDDSLSSDGRFRLWHMGAGVVARSSDLDALGTVEHLGGPGDDTLLGDINDILDGGAGTDTGSVPYVYVSDNDADFVPGAYERIRTEILPAATEFLRTYFVDHMTHFNTERVTPTISVTNLRAYESQSGLLPI